MNTRLNQSVCIYFGYIKNIPNIQLRWHMFTNKMVSIKRLVHNSKGNTHILLLKLVEV